MTNLDIINNPGTFVETYEKAKAVNREKKPINSSSIPLGEQLRDFEAASFSDEDARALHEDLMSL